MSFNFFLRLAHTFSIGFKSSEYGGRNNRQCSVSLVIGVEPVKSSGCLQWTGLENTLFKELELGNYDGNVVDEIIQVTDKDALAYGSKALKKMDFLLQFLQEW